MHWLLLILPLFTAGSAACFTHVLCRWVRSKGRRPSGWLGISGMVIAALVTFACIYQGDVLRPSGWNKDGDPLVGIVMLCVFLAIAVLPAAAAVEYHQKKFQGRDNAA